MHIGEEFRRLRIENGFTLEQVAKSTGTTRQNVSRFERTQFTTEESANKYFAAIGYSVQISVQIHRAG